MLVLGHSMSNQHKKILTLTDFNETWFVHGVCWDINPQWILAFCNVRMASELEPDENLIFRKFLAYLSLLNRP